MIWDIEIVNGGYGTPCIINDTIIMLKGFSDIVGINKNTGNIEWEFKTNKRIRTSIFNFNNKAYWSAGNQIFEITEEGKVTKELSIDGAFIFGYIHKNENYLIALGTKYCKEKKDSVLYIWVFKNNEEKPFEIMLDKSCVISADTSGFFISDNYLYVSCENFLYKINYIENEIIWKKSLNGYAGRHIPVVDHEYIYYTTLNGLVGKVNLEGDTIWEIKTKEGSIMSPPTLLGKTLFVIADAYIYLINTKTGTVYSKKALGHSPYSACVLKGNNLFVGGGEPPINGQFICYNILNEDNKDTYVSFNSYLVNNKIEDKKIMLIVDYTSKVNNVKIDPSVISESKVVYGDCSKNTYAFLISLKSNIIPGHYSLPIYFELNGKMYCESVVIVLHTEDKLPAYSKIFNLEKELKEEDVLYSGNAITELLLRNQGRKVEQKELRKIIDYVKDKSEWEDADFQTWRLILKRVLSSSANSLEEFIKNEQNK